MSTTTNNYGFIKPALTDVADITATNENWDKLDVELDEINDNASARDIELNGIKGDLDALDLELNEINNSLNTLDIEIDKRIDDLDIQLGELQITLNGKADYFDPNSYLKSSGGTVNGTLILSKVMDSDGDSYTAPALVVGGNPDTYHLEFDNNEVQAKQDRNTPGNLFLNSNGGKVSVGEGGIEVDANGGVYPNTKLVGSIGTSNLPFNNVYGRYVNIYGDSNKQYGRLRVGTTGTTTVAGTTTLELGNDVATGNEHNSSGKITMYGAGTGFTNILPNTNASGSNSVTLPTASGQLVVFESSTSDLTAGVTALSNGKLYYVYE